MAEIKETELLSNLVDIQQLYKNARNTKISNEDTQKFIDSIFGNYFLDNDNINFLLKNGYNFFSFDDEELCFCLSGFQFKNCCKLELKNEKNKNYIPFIKAIIKFEKYKDYLEFSSKLFEKVYLKLAKNEKCNLPYCQSSAVENSLYNINFDENDYVSSNKRNIFDNYYQMGLSFFNRVENNQFKFFGFCKEHDNQIKSIKITKDSVDQDILLLNFVTIVYKLFIARVQLQVLKEEFRSYFNSIDEENIKTLFIYNLKKISNHVSSLLEFYSFFIESLKGESMKYEIIKFTLAKTNNFKIFDVIQPQITPENFNVINSINNIFLTEKFATIVMQEDKKNSFVTMVFDKTNKSVKDFFDQYLKIIKRNSKSEEAFISNCALILADNIIYNEKWFNKLEEQEKYLYSALNKFRFEHPNMGQEYLKMKFFAGFNKGNNFF
ncbi:hypothetical protein [Spiroplasma floricola]|uniref:Uncharacterized protein n=1 Tax=Spiroplasma floricola 23-6 TaxID=1336749 RepID=A0A2K8SDH1_9MOLU|nr:hypothetical protein [Spiroplasma floricola]AUB31511.1 hypothetical protein SFLOR_v1c04590 [Spiroplasma floricola 23-6]